MSAEGWVAVSTLALLFIGQMAVMIVASYRIVWRLSEGNTKLNALVKAVTIMNPEIREIPVIRQRLDRHSDVIIQLEKDNKENSTDISYIMAKLNGG